MKGNPILKAQIELKIKDKDEYIRNLETENSFLRGQNQALKEKPSTKIDNQQINIIVPPSFLQLDTFPKLMKMVPDLLSTALSKHTTEFVSFLIGQTNCNPDRPLFNGAKITNKKDPYAKISDGKKYIYAPKKEVI